MSGGDPHAIFETESVVHWEPIQYEIECQWAGRLRTFDFRNSKRAL